MAFLDKVIDGGDIILKIDGAIVACSTSHSLELTNAVREISWKDGSDFTTSEYGRFSWTGSTDALVNLGLTDGVYVNYAELMQWMLNSSIVTIESLYIEDADAFSVHGEAIITSINKTAGDSENASYSVSLQGRGTLSIQEGLILASPVLGATPTMGASTAALTWTDVNTSPNETGVLVEYRKEEEDWETATITAADAVGYTVTGLDSITDYSFRVTAIGSSTVVDSEPSNIVTDTTL